MHTHALRFTNKSVVYHVYYVQRHAPSNCGLHFSLPAMVVESRLGVVRRSRRETPLDPRTSAGSHENASSEVPGHLKQLRFGRETVARPSVGNDCGVGKPCMPAMPLESDAVTRTRTVVVGPQKGLVQAILHRSDDWALRPVNRIMCDGLRSRWHEWVSSNVRDTPKRRSEQNPRERTTRRRHPCRNLSANPFADQGRSLPPLDPG